MRRELLFATHNRHKFEEVQHAMPVGFILQSLTDFSFNTEIPETGDTLLENALQKVRFVHQKLGKDCFADDTGLEVEALGGEPGVYSARYAGEPSDSEKNIALLLERLGDNPNRNARFSTIFALILNGKEHIFEGIVEGFILKAKQGESGFGYDPVFLPLGFDISFAQMSLSQKNEISHRTRALNKMTTFLDSLEKE